MARLELTERASGSTSVMYDAAASASLIGGSRFVGVGYFNPNGHMRVSADGVSWAAPGATPPSNNNYLTAVNHDGTYWYVGGGTGSNILRMWRSSDLLNWTAVYAPASGTASKYPRRIWFDGTNHAMCGDTGILAYSTNGGSTWAAWTGPTGTSGDHYRSITCNGSGRWVLSTTDGLYYNDTIGSTSWVAATVPFSGYNSFFRETIWNGSYYLVLAFDSESQRFKGTRQPWRVYTSTDGATWNHETGVVIDEVRRGSASFCAAWDSTQSKWLIGGAQLRVFEVSGSRLSLSIEENSYTAGLPVARVTDGSEWDYVYGLASANNAAVMVGHNGKMASGPWSSANNWATSPSPAHQEWGVLRPTTVSNTSTLSWTGGTGNVFFGKNPESLAAQGSQSSPWDPGTLDDNETYYWRVDVGGVTGSLWRFYTEPADTSEKLHTFGATYNVWTGSWVYVNASSPWTDRITFPASQLAGGHRYLVVASLMTYGGQPGSSTGMLDLQFYSEDANGREHYYDNIGSLHVGPRYSDQQKFQSILIPNPGESLKLRTRGHVDGAALQGLWVNLIDLDSPGMVEDVDWGYEAWGGNLLTDNSSTNDAYPLVDLEWTPDGESDYIVWAGAFWSNGGRYYNYPHGYRFRDYDTGQILARTGHIHGGDADLDYRDGNASMHTFKKPPASLKRLRMDVWGYGSGVDDSWRIRDCVAVWFRVSKMRNYAIDSSWRKKAHYSGSSVGRFNDVIANYSGQGMAPVNSVPFRPDADGTANFFCFLQGMGSFRAGGGVTTGIIGGIMSWGDFGRSAGYDKIWSTTRASPTKDQEFTASYDTHYTDIGSSSWYTEERMRDTIIGCRRKTGLANESRDLHLWYGQAREASYRYCHIHNVAAFGEEYCDAGAKPGIQQMVPTPSKRAVPNDEPITFKLSSENGVDVDLVRIKERWNPQKPVVMGGDAQTDGAQFYKVASNSAGVMVAASNKGKVYRSTDGGSTWTGITLPTLLATTFVSRDILWNPNLGVGGQFVGCSDAGIMYYSTDATGTVWAEVDLDAVNRLNTYSIAQNSSGIMVVTDNYNDTVWWSTNGSTWNQVTDLATQLGVTPTQMYSVDCDGTNFVASGRQSSGIIMTSTDGANWTLQTAPATSSNYFYDIAYGNGTWVIAIYYSSSVLVSTDRVNWTEHDLGSPAFGSYRVAFGNGEFLMQSGGGMGEYTDRSWMRDGRLVASIDGVNWEQIGHITDNEYKNGFLEGDYNSIFWNASWVEGSWWISAGRPAGAMIKVSSKLLGSSWENIIVDDVFQAGWDGVGSGITATPGISGMVDVAIDPGGKLKFWTNYLIEVQASDSVSGTPMEDYQWDFNTWGERLQIFNMCWRTGYGASPYSTYYDEVYNPAYDTSDPYYKFPEVLLPTKMFTNGHRYLVLGSGQSAGNARWGRWRIHRDGITHADPKVYHNPENFADGNQAQFMRKYDDIKEGEIFEWWIAVSNDAVTSYQAYIYQTYLSAIDLDSPGMIENTNWWYDEDAVVTPDVGSSWTPFASVTFDAIAGEDYLVIGCCQMRNATGYPNAAFRIYDVTGAASLGQNGFRSENTAAAEHCHMQAAALTAAATGPHTVHVDMKGASLFDHNFSSIFVLHLGLTAKHYAVVDNTLNQTGLLSYVHPHASGDATPKANLTLPGDAFGEIFAICVAQSDPSGNIGVGVNTELNGGRFADNERGAIGTYQIHAVWAANARGGGSEGRAVSVIPNIQYGHTGDNDLSQYVGSTSTSTLLERVAIIAFGTEPGEPPDVPVDLSFDPINTASSLDDITPDVSSPIPEPDVPDYPREVFGDLGTVGSKIALLEPASQTTDQLQIADRTHFTLVTTPTLDDLGVPPGDTGGTVRLGLLPGDRIVLSGAGPNDGVTYTIKDGNALEVLEEINDWSTDSAIYDFTAYRRK